MLYLWLERLHPTAPVRLSRVVAVAKAHGPARGLALLDDLDRRHGLDREPLTRQRERAVRAHLLRMTGDAGGAVPPGGRPDRQPGRAAIPARPGRPSQLKVRPQRAKAW
ncbi:hypothetical protein [Planobispora longispora]|uniref:Uncharacterized protein n=1 Tax=Planobispora longispora TaxID=28887 RepID=A0A8J3RJH4_9ACTN|nr:hypothetical protein [Planobispora longispora]GIH76822.1 hypothetical protein Plo01_32510 [Planobispora longispora]